MATAAYRSWVAAGRPWRDARPIAMTKDQLRAAYPGAVVGRSVYPTMVKGGIQTNDAHLMAATPEDHTPFPARPWPVPLPPKPAGYVVCAIDYMDSDGGLDCARLFERLLALAKAGRRPWTKYLNWRGERYDVRNDWKPVPVDGHFDHVHESVRSDWIDRSIADYPDPFVEAALSELSDRVLTRLDGRNTIGQVYTRIMHGTDELDPGYRSDVCLVGLVKRLEALAERPPVVLDSVSVVAAMAASPEFLDAFAAAVAKRIPDPAAAVAELRADLATAARAEVSALDDALGGG